MLEEQKKELYGLACEYMAETELYDRSLTPLRDRNGAAWVAVNPWMKLLSDAHARNRRRQYASMWWLIRKEIKAHPSYTADTWISEYERLQEEKYGVDTFADAKEGL